MFDSIFTTETITMQQAVISIVVAFILGFIISITYMKTSDNHSKNFACTLVIIPALISVVITLVNGNQATSIAILGAFSLIRFRSMQGTSKDLSYILFTMTLGLATGMGYIKFSVVLTFVVCLVLILLHFSQYGEVKAEKKDLRITIPENLDYTGIFDDIFEQYTSYQDLMRVKTTNLGSMYELQYHIILKDPRREKEMIDAIRTRNGNLNIVCGKMNFSREEL